MTTQCYESKTYTLWNLEELIEHRAVHLPGKAPPVNGVIFSGDGSFGANLSGLTFTNCVFQQNNLSKASFVGSQLTDCVFDKCDMPDATFAGASMLNVHIQRSDMIRACLDDATLDGCKLEKCVVSGTKMRRTTTRNSTLWSLKGTHVDFSEAFFGTTKFEHCEFAHAVFNRTHMADTKFLSTQIMRTFFQNVTLLGCEFAEGSRFVRCSVSESSFEGSNFRRALISDTLFLRTSFKQVQMDGDSTSVQDCSCDDCDFSDSTVTTRWQRSPIASANFTNCRMKLHSHYDIGSLPQGYRHFENTDQTSLLLGPGVNMKGAKIGSPKTAIRTLIGDYTGACFEEARFSNLDLSNSLFSNANLSNAVMSFVNVAGSVFDGADMTGMKVVRVHHDSGQGSSPESYARLGAPGLSRSSAKLTLAPLYYDDQTQWPANFQIPEEACSLNELEQAVKLVGRNHDGLESEAGVIFLPSPDPRNTMTLVFAALPDLFEVSGKLAVASRSAMIVENAMVSFASGVRKDDAGNALKDFEAKVEFAAQMVAVALTEPFVRACQETASDPAKYLEKVLQESMQARRRRRATR